MEETTNNSASLEGRFKKYIKTNKIFDTLKDMRSREVYVTGAHTTQDDVFRFMSGVILSLSMTDGEDDLEYPNNIYEGLREYLETGKIIDELVGMRSRCSFVTGPRVSQEDIFIQLAGLIVKMGMDR